MNLEELTEYLNDHPVVDLLATSISGVALPIATVLVNHLEMIEGILSVLLVVGSLISVSLAIYLKHLQIKKAKKES